MGFTKEEGYLREKIKVNCRETPINDPKAQYNIKYLFSFHYLQFMN